MAKRRVENSQEHSGPRTTVRSKATTCGWCLTGDCEMCKPELVWYDKLYVCGCKCKDSYVPQNVGSTVEPETKKKRGEDVLRDMPVSTEAGQEGSADSSHGDEPAELSGGEDSLETEPILGNE